jgi:acetoin utilization deacetylase AcuC-like enzyme
MALGIPVVWSDRCLLHEPGAEIWVGVRTPPAEVPERAERILEALTGAGAEVVDAADHDDAFLFAVHDGGLVRFLAGAWAAWEEARMPEEQGQDRVVPYVFPAVGLTSGRAALEPAATWARTGFWCFDTMTLIGPGTWEAVRAAVDCALTAVDRVRDGAPIAYACCRPPGHHAARALYGGSCYLNNAAVAAQALLEGRGRVAVVDLDAHHGNGAQAIFWTRGDVLTASVHVDPRAGWFPHFLGVADETGAGPGAGANLNLPLPPGAGDDGWLQAVEEAAAAVRRHEAEALVVALGVDAAAADPESPLAVTADGFRRAGRMLGALRLPTVVVQEGGYDLATIGGLVLAALEGLEQGAGGA